MDRKAVILFSIIMFAFIPSFAWFDSNYTNRQPIAMLTPKDVTSYPIKIQINSTNNGASFNWTQACSGKFRFVNSEDNESLEYWIQSCNSTSEILEAWVDMDSIVTTNGTQAYLYYNFDSATNASNHSNVFGSISKFYQVQEDEDIRDVISVADTGPTGSNLGLYDATGSFFQDLGVFTPQSVTTWYNFGDTNDYTSVLDIQFDCMLNSTGTGTIRTSVSKRQPTEVNGNYIIDCFRFNSTYRRILFFLYTGGFESKFADFQGADNVEHRIQVRFYDGNSSVELYANGNNILNDTMTKSLAATASPSYLQYRGQTGETAAGGISNVMFSTDGSTLKRMMYLNPEPVMILQAQESLSGISFNFTPASPNVLEPVDFTAEESGINITQWWWNFGDGSPIVSTANNFTTHTFNRGGSYEVNLTGLNESTNNVSVAKTVTVFEPTITIWARDIINDVFIENFTVTASNSTNTTIFTADGLTAIWNFTSGPYGSVDILIELAEFNHTSETISITNATTVNFTATVFPSLFIFRPVDFEFTNTSLPVTATMTNDSFTIVNSNEFEHFENLTTIVSDAGAITVVELGNFTTGQLFKYTLHVDISAGASGDGPNATIQIFNEDESSFFTLDSLTGFGPLTKTRYFFISKDATWKLLDTGFSEVDSGSFAFFPVKMRGRNRVDKEAGAATYTAESAIFRLNPNIFFTFPDNALTGNVSVKFEQRTTGVYGFLENIYEVNYLYFENVQETNLFNQTVYLVNEDTSFSVRFTILDSAAVPRSNAHVQIFRYDDLGNLEEISSSLTDASGNTPFFHFIRNSQIQVFASFGEETTDGIQNIFVSEDSLQVQLILGSQVLQVNPTPFASVFTFLSPEAGITLTENTTQLFNFTVIDTDASLTNTSIHLFSTDLGFSNFSSSSSSSAFNFESTIFLDSLNGSTATVFFVYNITKTNAEGGTDFLTATVEWLVYPDFSLRNINELSDDLGNFKYLFGLILLIIGFTVGKWTGLGATAGAWFFGWLPDSSIWIAGILTVIYTWSDGRK